MLTDGMATGGTAASSPKLGGAPAELLASTIATPPAAWTTEAFVLNEQVPRSTRTTLPPSTPLSGEHAVDGDARTIRSALRSKDAGPNTAPVPPPSSSAAPASYTPAIDAGLWIRKSALYAPHTAGNAAAATTTTVVLMSLRTDIRHS